MTPLLFWALKFALFLLAVAMLCAVYRLLAGPTAQDRIMALDCLYLNGMLMMLVLGIVYASDVYLEAALLIALFGFVSSTALAKFLLRGEVIEGLRPTFHFGQKSLPPCLLCWAPLLRRWARSDWSACRLFLSAFIRLQSARRQASGASPLQRSCIFQHRAAKYLCTQF